MHFEALMENEIEIMAGYNRIKDILEELGADCPTYAEFKKIYLEEEAAASEHETKH